MEKENLQILKQRDQACSAFLANGWVISEDNVGSRQATLKSEWTAGSWILVVLLLMLYIIPGLIYIGVKLSKKRLVNY